MAAAAGLAWAESESPETIHFSEHVARRTPAQARLDMMLISGGDERIWLDPVTRRNRYGAPASPAAEELWFSSAAASAISPRGYAAATRAFYAHARLGAGPAALFDDIRARIAALVGLPGVEVALAASAAEAEYAALAVAETLFDRPLTNILVAPQETSDGAFVAASGRHLGDTAAFAPHVERGALLAGWPEEDILLRAVAIRDEEGMTLPSFEVDRAAAREVAVALAQHRAPVLHLLDSSKTGRGGVSREAARGIVASCGDRALVVVDASQLRCGFEDIRADLEAGFLVVISGSKFAGGPAFCGALLIPPCKAAGLREMKLPTGLGAYTARLDWSENVAHAFCAGTFAPANLGLALRWVAALSEMEAFAATPGAIRQSVIARFAETVRRAVASNMTLDFLDAESWRLGQPSTIYPIVALGADPVQSQRLHDALAAPLGVLGEPDLDRVCHLGQIIVGERAALTISLSMSQINAVAERLAQNMDFDAAFTPLRRDIDLLFRKLEALLRRAQTGAPPMSRPVKSMLAPAHALRARLGVL
jgi:hypothetical protein